MEELAVLDVQGFPLDRDLYVGYPAGKQLSIVANAFLAFLQDEGKRLAEQRRIIFTNLYRESA
jgi:hypothetical protein